MRAAARTFQTCQCLGPTARGLTYVSLGWKRNILKLSGGLKCAATGLEMAVALYLLQTAGDPWVAETAEVAEEQEAESGEGCVSIPHSAGPAVDLTG